MVHAIILLNVQSTQINPLAERLASLEGVSEVYSVAGKFDLAVMVRARDNEAVADLVTQKMLSQPGILRSETLISFRVFSRYDLERMFSVGLDDDGSSTSS
jgi:DNA-binding Lrp family transcriptional regulator